MKFWCPLAVLFSLTLVSLCFGDVAILEDKYAKSLADAGLEQQAALKKLDAQFLQRLEALRGEFEKAGDLDGVLAARSAMQSVVKKAALGKDAPESLRDARAIYDKSRAELDAEHHHGQLKLRAALVEKLEALVIEHTKRSEFDEAVAVRDKIKTYALTDEEKALAANSTVEFFGVTAEAQRAVFIVDFSGSMSQGDRLATLKRGLDHSLAKLPAGLQFNIIYYSHRPWLGGETVGSAPFRDPEDPRDRIAWRTAGEDVIAKTRAEVAGMGIGGATNWIPPIQLALAMVPPPDVIWLLTDGEASDRGKLFKDLSKINPNKVPIHTVGLEIGGPTFQALIEIAEKTGGKYSIGQRSGGQSP